MLRLRGHSAHSAHIQSAQAGTPPTQPGPAEDGVVFQDWQANAVYCAKRAIEQVAALAEAWDSMFPGWRTLEQPPELAALIGDITQAGVDLAERRPAADEGKQPPRRRLAAKESLT